MIFLFNQHRILKHISHFGYKHTETQTDMGITLPELRNEVCFISDKRLFYHCIILEKLGYITMDTGKEHFMKTTPDGWHYFFENKRKVYFSTISAFWTLCGIGIGAYLAYLTALATVPVP